MCKIAAKFNAKMCETEIRENFRFRKCLLEKQKNHLHFFEVWIILKKLFL